MGVTLLINQVSYPQFQACPVVYKWQSNIVSVRPREANFTETLRDKQPLQPPRITPWDDTSLVSTKKLTT